MSFYFVKSKTLVEKSIITPSEAPVCVQVKYNKQMKLTPVSGVYNVLITDKFLPLKKAPLLTLLAPHGCLLSSLQ